MPKHTPSPWKLLPIAQGKAGHAIIGADNHTVLLVPFSIRKHDLLLITEAPNLLAHLKTLIQPAKLQGIDTTLAELAIKQAEGEEDE